MQIHEVMEITGISKKALQYYEEKKLIEVEKDASGYRVYTEEQIAVLWNIKVLRKLDFSIPEIELILHREQCEEIFQKHFNEVDKRRAQCDIQKEYMKSLYDNMKEPLDVEYLQEMDQYIHKDMELQENIEVKMTGYPRKYRGLCICISAVCVWGSIYLVEPGLPLFVQSVGSVIFVLSIVALIYFINPTPDLTNHFIDQGIKQIKSSIQQVRRKRK